jgi:general secretion pathway protein E
LKKYLPDSDFLRQLNIVPFFDSSQCWVASDTPGWAIAIILANFDHPELKICIKTKTEIKDEIARSFTTKSSAADIIFEAGEKPDLNDLLEEPSHDGTEIDFDDEAPVIRMINAVLLEANQRAASDVHFEPYEDNSVVRFRVDGILTDIAHPPRSLHSALISRIKILGQLDIAEKRLPQDGRMSIRLNEEVLDVRISTLPTGVGERAVLRLLDKKTSGFLLPDLGMTFTVKRYFEESISRPHGIVLVTGPTGSGKTTTLYASLEKLNAKETNIMTVEDPVEFELNGISQTQVQVKIGLNFSTVLRAILRQDPDVIMIGEIRDLETAQIAVQASLTGHLVLATLHTNDSTSAIVRLVDMGIEPYLLSSTLNGVLAQRLVRKICNFCRNTTSKSSGCEKCNFSGYKGRTGIYEFFQINDEIRALIKDTNDLNTLRQIAIKSGMDSLFNEGERLVREKITSIEEINRVTSSVEELH